MEVLPILKEKVAFLSGESIHNVHHTSHKGNSNASLNANDAIDVCGRKPREQNWPC